MLFLSKRDFIQFIRPPYTNARTACGINTLIEMKRLPVNKLRSVNFEEIKNKLSELSSNEEFHFETECELSVFFHFILDKCELKVVEHQEFVRECALRYYDYCLTGILKIVFLGICL